MKDAPAYAHGWTRFEGVRINDNLNYSGTSRMRHSDHGIDKDNMAQDQPGDKERAQKADHSKPDKSASHEATRKPETDDRKPR
jgi:hypothetical protein